MTRSTYVFCNGRARRYPDGVDVQAATMVATSANNAVPIMHEIAGAGSDAVACISAGRLTDADAQLLHLAVNLKRTPERIRGRQLGIRTRRSAGTPGRPARRWLLQIQNRRRPCRCQATTVLGWMMCVAPTPSRARSARAMPRALGLSPSIGSLCGAID